MVRAVFGRRSHPLAPHPVGIRSKPVFVRSRIRIRCNGWRTNDLLKIFVRSPSGGSGCMKCCDLTIGLVKSAPLTSTSPSSAKYGLLWADPEDIDEGLGRKGGWRKEDVSRRFFTWGTGSAVRLRWTIFPAPSGKGVEVARNPA